MNDKWEDQFPQEFTDDVDKSIEELLTMGLIERVNNGFRIPERIRENAQLMGILEQLIK